MPGISIHLSVANKYLEMHEIKDKDAFLLGSVSPDLGSIDENLHHSAPNYRDNAISFLKGKVNLKKCLPDFDINTDFGKGYFLHLITDYEFSQLLLKDEEKYKDWSYREFKDPLYNDYAVTNRYFREKYHLVFPEIVKEFDIEEEGAPIIINLKDTDKLIEWLGSLDLNKYLDAVKDSEA